MTTCDAVGVAAAAVDVGSNSVRLLVVAADGRRITREMAITRLARGIDRTGSFDPQALATTVDVITGFVATARKFVTDEHLAIAATAAVRDAADRDHFVTAVTAATGVTPWVLSGDQEAAFAFSGAVEVIDADQAVVVDIGGGSTELVVGHRDGGKVVVDASISLQMGCVRMTERHLATDPPTRDERLALALDIAQRLDEAQPIVALDQLGDRYPLVAVAGTATTIGALHLGLAAYDEDRIHGTTVEAGALDVLTRQLVSMNSAQRSQLGPMQPGRHDVIHAGAMVLNSVVRRGGFAEVVISEADSLDGIVAWLRARHRDDQ